MGIRLLEGRDFATRDDAGSAGVVIVSESVTQRVWPGENAMGKRVSMDTEHPTPSSWLTVVGVVNDVVQDRSMGKRSTMYFPYLQSSWSFMLGHMTYVVRADASANIAPTLRATLRAVDPNVPAQNIMSMNDALMDVVAEPVFQTRVLSVFAAIAILLAAIGTYGVLAYDVTERSREIALRMALGAQPADVIWMVLRRTGRLALSGTVVGLVGSFALTGVLRSSLYDVRPTDPETTIVVVVAVLGIAVLAGYLPARRASRMQVARVLPGD
jgi:putative ABC transport system permease protein